MRHALPAADASRPTKEVLRPLGASAEEALGRWRPREGGTRSDQTYQDTASPSHQAFAARAVTATPTVRSTHDTLSESFCKPRRRAPDAPFLHAEGGWRTVTELCGRSARSTPYYDRYRHT